MSLHIHSNETTLLTNNYDMLYWEERISMKEIYILFQNNVKFISDVKIDKSRKRSTVMLFRF